MDETPRVTAAFASGVDAPDGLVAVDLPAVEVASLTHVGPMEGLTAAWQALHSWIDQNGYGLTDEPGREIYLSMEADADPSTWVTELQQPVSRRA